MLRESRGKTIWGRLWPVLCCAAVFAMLFFIQSVSGLYADDYNYSVFWRDGPAQFVKRNVEHYLTFNGRVLVHLAAQTLLAFPHWVSAAVDTALLLLTGLLGMKTLRGERDRRETLAGAALFGASLLLVGREVLRESLLWMSAFYNYFFPIILLLPACAAWEKWLRQGRWGQLWWLLPVQLLCGATTELCGAMATAATGCLSLCWLWRERPGLGRGWRSALAPLMNLLGYLTIFLSPATRNRAESTASFSLAALLHSVHPWAQNLLRPDGIVPVLLLFCLAAALYGGIQGGKLRLLMLGLPVAAALGAYLLLDSPAQAAAVVLALVMAYLLLSAAALFLEGQGLAAALLAAAVAGQLVMLPTNTFVPRTVIPFILPLLLVGASFLSRCLGALRPRRRGKGLLPSGLVCLATALSLLNFLPTAAGYWKNHLLDVKNEAAAARARETGVLYYCVDYDPQFGMDTRMFDGDYFRLTYLEMEQLSGAGLYFTSATHPAVLVNGTRMQCPAWTDGGKAYLPIAQIVRALGGTVEWTPASIRYCLNGVDASLEASSMLFTCRKGEAAWTVDAHSEVLACHYTNCFTPKVLEEVLGLVFRYDPEVNVYYLSGTAEVPAQGDSRT